MKISHRICLAAFLAIGAAQVYGAVINNLGALKISRVVGHPSRSEAEEGDDEEELPPYDPMILQVSDLSVKESLENLGVIIFNNRDNLLLTSIPREHVAEVLSLDGVLNAAMSGDMSMAMDLARPFASVNVAQNGGEGLPEGYDGSGVVAGFSDTGFDAKHIAFAGRVKGIYDYDAPNGTMLSATTQEQIGEWITDNPDQFHATHVANILAGGYKGNDLYGVAPGADIFATTSRLTDVGILAGVEDIIAYAKSTGSRAVINLSLANYLGPHDGSDLMCRYLSECAKDAVICISAGNTGSVNGFALHEFTSTAPLARVNVNDSKTWLGLDVDGCTDIWGADGTPFRFRVEVYNVDSREILYSSPWIGGDTGTDLLELNEADYPEWGTYMTGSVRAKASLSPLDNRYNVTVLYDTHTVPVSSRGPWALYMTVLCVESPEGTSVAYFADSSASFLGAVAGSTTKINSLGSINDMCTAHGIVAVGACNTRNTAPALYGDDDFHWNFTVGNVAGFSSLADVPVIERLPHFCAPGNYVVSATSGPYLESHPDIRNSLSAVAEVDGKDYYWFPKCGTSMASPFAAGVIALWLQANSSLSTDDIIEIAQLTADKSFPDFTNPRWSAGCINAAAGLRYIVENTSAYAVPSVKPLVEVGADRRLSVTFPGGCELSVALWSIDGSMHDISSPLLPGIYLVSITGYPAVKIAVR